MQSRSDTDPLSPQTTLSTLQSQIDTLTEFSTRLQTLRQLPPLLLRAGPSSDPSAMSLAGALRRALQEVRGVQTELSGEKVQGALKAAAQSDWRDRAGVKSGVRRENHKRRYVACRSFVTPSSCKDCLL